MSMNFCIWRENAAVQLIPLFPTHNVILYIAGKISRLKNTCQGH